MKPRMILLLVAITALVIIAGCDIGMQVQKPATDAAERPLYDGQAAEIAPQNGMFDEAALPPSPSSLAETTGEDKEDKEDKPTGKTKTPELGQVVVDYDDKACRYKEEDEARDNIRIIAGTVERELLALGAKVIADVTEAAKLANTIRGKNPYDMKVSVCLSLVDRGYLPQGVEREKQQAAVVTVRFIDADGLLLVVKESFYLFNPISGGHCPTCGADEPTAFTEAAKLAIKKAVEKLP